MKKYIKKIVKYSAIFILNSFKFLCRIITWLYLMLLLCITVSLHTFKEIFDFFAELVYKCMDKTLDNKKLQDFLVFKPFN